MSIARLQRITIIGKVSDKAELLSRLQSLGCVHITPMGRGRRARYDAETTPEAGAAISRAYKALKFLTDSPYRRSQVEEDPTFDLNEMVSRVLALRTRLRLANDRRDFLEDRIADVESWGEIEFATEQAPGGWHLWFYELPLRYRAALDAIDQPWQIVARDHRTAYVVVLAREEPAPDLLPVPRIHLGSTPLSALRRELREAEIEIDDLVAERVALTRFIYLVTENLYQAEDTAALSEAVASTWEDESLVAVQGWAPEERLDDLGALAHAMGLALVSRPPAPGEEPPTLLQQPTQREAGVELAMFYQVPAYGSWDPSLLLLISFPLFFAMIMADAGYGLVLAGGVAFGWRPMGRTRGGRAYRRLGVVLASVTIAYGILVGSYFGLSPPGDTLLASLQMLAINDFDTMMKLSVGVGVLHIVLANVLAARAEAGRVHMVSRLGWAAICIGAYTLYLNATSGAPSPGLRALAIAIILTGAVSILLFSSRRAGRSAADQAWRLLDGVQALVGVMGAFGDVLSYMRLFALGLASASLAITFNQLASDAQAALPGLGLLAAMLILVIGHVLNFLLAVISGVVHGLRLNYIEFFKWGFDEEGEAFRPFAKKWIETHE